MRTRAIRRSLCMRSRAFSPALDIRFRLLRPSTTLNSLLYSTLSPPTILWTQRSCHTRHFSSWCKLSVWQWLMGTASAARDVVGNSRSRSVMNSSPSNATVLSSTLSTWYSTFSSSNVWVPSYGISAVAQLLSSGMVIEYSGQPLLHLQCRSAPSLVISWMNY
jgi:hypothetical protein